MPYTDSKNQCAHSVSDQDLLCMLDNDHYAICGRCGQQESTCAFFICQNIRCPLGNDHYAICGQQESDQDLRCLLGNDHYAIIMRAARIIVRILRLIRTSDARLGMTIMPYAGSKSQRAHSTSDQDLRCPLTEPEDTISALGLLFSHLALGFSSEVAYHF